MMLPKVKAELVIATLEIDVNEIMNMTLYYMPFTQYVRTMYLHVVNDILKKSWNFRN